MSNFKQDHTSSLRYILQAPRLHLEAALKVCDSTGGGPDGTCLLMKGTNARDSHRCYIPKYVWISTKESLTKDEIDKRKMESRKHGGAGSVQFAQYLHLQGISYWVDHSDLRFVPIPMVVMVLRNRADAKKMYKVNKRILSYGVQSLEKGWLVICHRCHMGKVEVDGFNRVCVELDHLFIAPTRINNSTSARLCSPTGFKSCEWCGWRKRYNRECKCKFTHNPFTNQPVPECIHKPLPPSYDQLKVRCKQQDVELATLRQQVVDLEAKLQDQRDAFDVYKDAKLVRAGYWVWEE
jgi:hypothetical protein